MRIVKPGAMPGPEPVRLIGGMCNKCGCVIADVPTDGPGVVLWASHTPVYMVPCPTLGCFEMIRCTVQETTTTGS